MSEVTVLEEHNKNYGGRRPGAGRKAGVPNKSPRDLKQAMFDGAVLSDYAKDPKHPNAPGSLT